MPNHINDTRSIHRNRHRDLVGLGRKRPACLPHPGGRHAPHLAASVGGGAEQDIGFIIRAGRNLHRAQIRHVVCAARGDRARIIPDDHRDGGAGGPIKIKLLNDPNIIVRTAGERDIVPAVSAIVITCRIGLQDVRGIEGLNAPKFGSNDIIRPQVVLGTRRAVGAPVRFSQSVDCMPTKRGAFFRDVLKYQGRNHRANHAMAASMLSGLTRCGVFSWIRRTSFSSALEAR